MFAVVKIVQSFKHGCSIMSPFQEKTLIILFFKYTRYLRRRHAWSCLNCISAAEWLRITRKIITGEFMYEIILTLNLLAPTTVGARIKP